MNETYFEQALKLHKAGKDAFPLLQEHQRSQLRSYQASGVVKKVEILTAGDSSCEKCKSLHGKILTISEAFRTMPIPVANCKNAYGYCRCVYLPVID